MRQVPRRGRLLVSSVTSTSGDDQGQCAGAHGDGHERCGGLVGDAEATERVEVGVVERPASTGDGDPVTGAVHGEHREGGARGGGPDHGPPRTDDTYLLIAPPALDRSDVGGER